MIVMLNLLIAIISETFATVQANAENAGYQEKAKMIFDNSFMVPNSSREKHCDANSYLLFVEKKEIEVEDHNDENTAEMLKEIHDLLVKKKEKEEEY